MKIIYSTKICFNHISSTCNQSNIILINVHFAGGWMSLKQENIGPICLSNCLDISALVAELDRCGP